MHTALLGAFWVWVIATGIYFLPTIIAASRSHRSGWAIFAVNFFLGWTAIGWFVALIWSLADADNRHIIIQNSNATYEGTRREPIFDSNKGMSRDDMDLLAYKTAEKLRQMELMDKLKHMDAPCSSSTMLPTVKAVIKLCPKCNAEVGTGDRFCGSCGARL
ncbi:superinfection immunity protein [Acidithiobacillus ferrooxidans]|uniref:superinfection immunity protein n=1 Tax=Acidithiobacillus ferrooxidans TaxID=920 RepID=UPI00214B9FB3|nr:superinfection immunity protein [Acidithiobacillus ferrooxidans]MCR2830809.1 superinfection immunity protein [Acidithiobacillus ferrooxidans]